MRYPIFLLLVTFFLSHVYAQELVKPPDGALLNFRQILFEAPQYPGATSYSFTFLLCNKLGEDCQLSHQVESKNRAIVLADKFAFGNTYRWSYEALRGANVLHKSPDFIFNIASSELLDTTLQKVVWSKRPNKKEKGILMIDGLKLAVDMQGNPILFLPYAQDYTIRDINLTPQGTLTFIDNKWSVVREIQTNGELVWTLHTVPDAEAGKEQYHHEFEKLPNGHYLVAGKKKVSQLDEKHLLPKVPESTSCETIIEFNSEGEEVWRFNLLPELKKQLNIQPDMNMFNPHRMGHLNGIAIGKDTSIVYASFKTFNTVFKINKITNRIEYMYGTNKISFVDSMEYAGAFAQQHCPILLKNGNLMIFNNGTHKTGSGIVELKTGDHLSKQNEVIRKINFADLFSNEIYTPQMGSVQEVGKSSILVGMGNQPYFFELNSNNLKINYKAYTFYNEQWHKRGVNWKPLVNYRVFKYSSLYPYHFIVDTLTTQNEILKLVIYNIGSEDDEYIVEAHDGSPVFQTPIKVKAGRKRKLNIRLPNRAGIQVYSPKSKQLIKI